MKRIFKYSLEILDRQEVELPAGAKILSVQAQNGLPQIWAMVDDSQVKTDMVHIRIIGTGYEIPDADSLEYIGTDVHQMVDNKGEKIGCYECSLFNMCSRLGNSQTPLCDSLIKENADCDYQGGHFILK